MTRQFPDWLTAYTEALTPRGEAPERYHFWTAVSTVAGALRRRVYFDEGHFRRYSNMYIVLVGPPGVVKKSTTINIGKTILKRVPGVNIGPDNATWQAFVEELSKAEDIFAEGAPSLDMLEQKQTVTCALSMYLSELGTFFDPEDATMVNMLTEFYDGRTDDLFRKQTKTQGEEVIMNPFVNFIAGTTPKWIKDNFSVKFSGWGLSSRMIFLHCDEPERTIAYPKEFWPGNSYEETVEALAADLLDIARLQGPVTLSPEAYEFGRHWYEAIHSPRIVAVNRHDHHDPWLSAYLARKFDHVNKLAMIFSVARRSDLVISLTDIQEATRRCNQIEDELSKVFASRYTEDRDAKVNVDVWRGLSARIAEHGRIRQRDIWGFTINYMTYGKAKALLEHLVASRWLVVENEPGGPFYSLGENAPGSE